MPSIFTTSIHTQFATAFCYGVCFLILDFDGFYMQH